MYIAYIACTVLDLVGKPLASDKIMVLFFITLYYILWKNLLLN